MKTYIETLDYLYNALPMFSRIGSAAYKKDLTNVRLLLAHLGDPQLRFKSIHVGGTNGKGSVSHMLAAVFQQCGYKTGLYTSPHLQDFRERIRINGVMVPEETVVRITQDLLQQAEQIHPSFFELTVAMCFQYFAEESVDIAIIEVGLGGRLDSTNIITPELSVITNIGWDHMNILGNSLAEIATEKAGIIKEKIPVVIGEALPDTRPVFERIALEKLAPLYFAEDQFEILQQTLLPNSLRVSYKNKKNELLAIQSDLPGIYQTKNLQTTLSAIDVLKGLSWSLESTNVLAALRQVKALTGLRGRWEVIHQNPVVVLEVAHNREGIAQMLHHINQLSFKQLHLVFGMVNDKDAASILSLLPVRAYYYFAAASIPRAMAALELQAQAKTWNLAGNAFANVHLALKAALHNAEPDDLIIVCGSIFLVAEV
ncbi:MAG TPA: folylpolyglutamate synthase/dihydrofolate synthase family protein, partial [Flavisolibacter sp.]|nr:folylpolyglutamate synthase/dihydrofolate synthase family protein [Flavisolibacter sp.]